MALPEPIRPNGSKTGSVLSHARRLAQTPYNLADDRPLPFGRAHHDFDPTIGTLLFD
jgi:hypothetical protein